MSFFSNEVGADPVGAKIFGLLPLSPDTCGSKESVVDESVPVAGGSTSESIIANTSIFDNLEVHPMG
jgi:hypothetical protein